MRASAGAASFRRKQTLKECRKEAEAALEALKKDLHEDGSSSTTRQRSARERAAKERRADLVILATHGYTGLRHVLLGSVAEKVVRHAPCLVLTVRADEKDFS